MLRDMESCVAEAMRRADGALSLIESPLRTNPLSGLKRTLAMLTVKNGPLRDVSALFLIPSPNP